MGVESDLREDAFLPSRGQGRDNTILSANKYRGQRRDNTEDLYDTFRAVGFTPDRPEQYYSDVGKTLQAVALLPHLTTTITVFKLLAFFSL